MPGEVPSSPQLETVQRGARPLLPVGHRLYSEASGSSKGLPRISPPNGMLCCESGLQ